MSAFSVTTVCRRDSGAGWLITGVELMVTDRLPCATAQGPSVTAWFITIEPVRALITTLRPAWPDPAAGSPVGQEGHAVIRGLAGHAPHHAAVQRLGGALRPWPC
jgi:hypothetical protein